MLGVIKLKVFTKQLIVLTVSCIFMSLLEVNASAEGIIDDSVDSSDSSTIDTDSVDFDVTTAVETGTITETDTTQIFADQTSAEGLNVVVTNDNMFTGLDTIVNTYSVDLPSETKTLMLKSLCSLIVSVVSGDASYTLDSFVTSFTEILGQYGVEVTDDIVDAVTKYAVYYLDDCFEQNDTNMYLSGIYSSLGFITVLLIALWQGGGNFR